MAELLGVDRLTRKILRSQIRQINKDYRPYTDSTYLYREVLAFRNVRKNPGKYAELIYATLCSWNMNERAARLQTFHVFKKSLLACYEKSRLLRNYRLENIDSEVLSQQVMKLFNQLNVVHGQKPKLVTASKCLHFLLPELVMPIDRTYTLKFFKIHDYQLKKFRTIDVLLNIVESSRQFAVDHASMLRPLVAPGKNPNLPKLIDNLVIHAIKN